MTVLERRPCTTVEACKSTVIEGEYLPGYDAATHSITTRVEIIETESWVMTIARYPNHPTQQLLTFTDHVARTTREIQFTSPEIFTRCRSDNYTTLAHFSADDWYVTYVQDVEKPEAVYDFLDESYTVNSSINRYFHLISKNVSADTPDQDAILEFEDDLNTLLMKRAFVPNASAEGWDLQEVIVLDVEEINDADAASILEDYAELFFCGNESNDTMTLRSDFPVIDDPFDETLEQVLFYTQEFIEIDSLGFGSYWSEAVVGQDALLELYATQQAELEAMMESNITNESDRRLASIEGVPSSSSLWCIPSKTLSNKDTSISFCHHLAWPNRRSDCPGCMCNTFSVSGGPAEQRGAAQSGWFGSGSVSLGNFCVYPGRFGVSGTVEAGYVAVLKQKKKGVGFDCELRAFGSVTGSYGRYDYKCSNDKAGCLKEKEGEKAWWEWSCAIRGYPIYDGYLRRLSEDENATSIEAADEVEGEPEVDEDVVDRRLGGRRRRRRRWGVQEYTSRRRNSKTTTYCSRDEWEKDWGNNRRRTRTTWGGEIAFRIGAMGGCEAGPVGVGIKGHFEIAFGPFPKNPLVPKNTGKMSFEACVKLGVKICVKLFHATLWSKRI